MDDALNHFTDVDHCSHDQLEDLIQLAMGADCIVVRHPEEGNARMALLFTLTRTG